MSAGTGLECVVVTELAALPRGWNPSWAKARAFDLLPPDVERVLVFDADILCVGKWGEWDTDAPLAVVRHIENQDVKTEMALYGFEDYWNAGLFVARREVEEELRSVANYGPRYGKWLEQDAMNRVFQYREKLWLPGRCNHLLAAPAKGAPQGAAVGAALGAIEAGAINLHFTGYGGDADKVAWIYDELEPLL